MLKSPAFTHPHIRARLRNRARVCKTDALLIANRTSAVVRTVQDTNQDGTPMHRTTSSGLPSEQLPSFRHRVWVQRNRRYAKACQPLCEVGVVAGALAAHTLQAVVDRLRNNYKPITELRTAVIWTKGVSAFQPITR